MNDTGKPPVPAPGRLHVDARLATTPPRWLSTRRPASAMERAVSCGIGVVATAGARSLHTIEEAPMRIFHNGRYPTSLNR